MPLVFICLANQPTVPAPRMASTPTIRNSMERGAESLVAAGGPPGVGEMKCGRDVKEGVNVGVSVAGVGVGVTVEGGKINKSRG